MQVAVYVRVSTQRQAQAQTIEQQLERLCAHIQAQGWQIADDNIFRDDGYSGAGLNRPGLDRLRDRAAQAEFQRVLITAPDRLARKYVHQVLLIEELERYGCQVEFLDRPMSQDPHDQLLLQIRGAVSEYERSLIAERMRRGRQAKYRAGILLPWTRAPYGLQMNPDHPRDPKGVRLEATEAATVGEMFVYYLEEGHSLFGLAKHLIANQIPSPRGQKRWNQATLRGILTNPVYTGKVYAARTRPRPARVRRSALKPLGRPTTSRVVTDSNEWILVAPIPAIVSQEQFAWVQAKLAQNQQFAKRHSKSHEYLLRALVSCGVCQCSCMARTNSPGYAYYVCRGKLHAVQSCHDEKCPARFIPAPQLDALVWQDLCDVLTHPESIRQARRENLRKARVSLDHQLERLTEAYLSSVLLLAEYQRRRQDLEQKQHGLDTQVQQLETSANRHTEVRAPIAQLLG
ncbi:MAG: recombinase family protein [Chloroflexi bacterium]|nr:recombinase family protein [Chloroflexota bacterium]